jgi:uncharacterized protein YqjF (DUF2071 family)
MTVSRIPPDRPSTVRRAEIVAPLFDLAMVSYAVPPDRVNAHLAPGCELQTRLDSDGKPWAFVSAVMFENRRTGPAQVPWLRFTFPQINYRTYVHCQGIEGAMFFAVALGSRMADLQRLVFRSPSYRAALRLDALHDPAEQRYQRYRFESTTPGLQVRAEIDDAGEVGAPGNMFASAAEMVTWLTMRPEGFYRQVGTAHTARMTVWHDPMQPRAGTLRVASFETLDRLGVVPFADQVRPFAVFLQPRIDFYGINPRRMH